MSTTTITTLQSADQDIPLQLRGQPVDSFPRESGEVRGDDERNLLALQTPQAPSSSESEQREDTNQRGILPNSHVNASKAEGWQIRLNAVQVLLGSVSLVGFLVMLYPQIISLKLAQWTAEKDFRDECRTLMSEIRDIGEDCRHILHQPLSKPPTYADLFRLPTHRDAYTDSYEYNNITLSYRDQYLSPDSLDDQRGRITTYNTLMLPAILMSTVFIFTAATCWRNMRRSTHIVCNTWVASHVPRVEPKILYEYTAIQVLVTDKASLRQKLKGFPILAKPMQSGSELNRSLESTNITEYREKSSETSVVSKRASGWEEGSKLVTTDDGGDESLGAWLPVATGMECDSTYQQQDSKIIKYRATLELVIDKLYGLGYRRFAFRHLKPDHSPFSHVAAVRQHPHVQDYSTCYESTSWLENLSTPCTIFPEVLNTYLKTHPRRSNGAWLAKIPGFSPDLASVSLTHSRVGRSDWHFLEPGESLEKQSHQPDAPCLWVASITRNRALLVFANTTLLEYSSLMEIVQVKDQIEPLAWTQQEENNFAAEISFASFHQNALLQTRRAEQLFQWQDQGILEPFADSHSLHGCCLWMKGHFIEGPTSDELGQLAEQSIGAMQGWPEERISTAYGKVQLDSSLKRTRHALWSPMYTRRQSELLTRTNAISAFACPHRCRLTLSNQKDLDRHVNKAHNSIMRAERLSAHKMRIGEDVHWRGFDPSAHDTLITSRHAMAQTQPRDESQLPSHKLSDCLSQGASTIEPYVDDQCPRTDENVEPGASRETEEQPYNYAQLSRDIANAEEVQRRIRSAIKSLRKRPGFKGKKDH